MTRKQIVAIAVLVVIGAAVALVLLRSRAHCRRDAHELAVWAETVRADGAPMMFHDPHAAAHLDAPPADISFAANVIEIKRDHVAYPDPARSRTRDLRVLLAIDADVPVADVAPALDRAIGDGLTEAYVAVVRKAKLTAPPRSSISDELDALRTSDDPSSRATRFAKLFSRAIDSCPAFKKEMGRVSGVPEDKGRWFVSVLEPSLVDCGCDVDLDDLRTLIYGLLGPNPEGEAMTVFPITLDPAGARMHAATWGDLVPALYAARGTRVHITP